MTECDVIECKEMGKRTTRRSISVKGLTYQRIKKYCDTQAIAVSAFLEEVIAERMEREGVPEELVLSSRNSAIERRNDALDEITSQHFTF
jgi:hypothetical protein